MRFYKKGKWQGLSLLLAAIVMTTGCGAGGGNATPDGKETTAPTQAAGTDGNTENGWSEEEVKQMEKYAKLFEGMKKVAGDKSLLGNNPLMTQRFGADPYAMVYEDTVYIYMTGDVPEYNADGSLATNTYSKINTINVISSKDLVNWTDHGSVHAAGKQGAATWANNSWAPAATWKMIDGKPKFFLYFANSGGGIGVLTSDSPTGPFVDPIGEALVSRNTPTCDSVLWLFDPAVLIDDDGSAYLYCGGGVPEGKAAHPCTARVVKLGEDMISLDGDPVMIDAPFLFEDSGINKIGDTYYYSYCSNFSVTAEGTAEYKLKNGQICYMTSNSPMGPFTYQGVVLPNPGEAFTNGGNNHHWMFEFQGEWYITYHAQTLEEKLGMSGGYRCTHIDVIDIKEDGSIGRASTTMKGVEQVGTFDPYQKTGAATMSVMSGISTTACDETSKKYGSGNMAVTDIDTGDWLCLKGVNFGETGATKFRAVFEAASDNDGVVEIRLDNLNGTVAGYVPVNAAGKEGIHEETMELLNRITGTHTVYFIFYGAGYQWASWQFE